MNVEVITSGNAGNTWQIRLCLGRKVVNVSVQRPFIKTGKEKGGWQIMRHFSFSVV